MQTIKREYKEREVAMFDEFLAGLQGPTGLLLEMVAYASGMALQMLIAKEEGIISYEWDTQRSVGHAMVDLDEGPRMETNLVECPLDQIHVGMRVTVVFEDEGELVLPRFRPV